MHLILGFAAMLVGLALFVGGYVVWLWREGTRAHVVYPYRWLMLPFVLAGALSVLAGLGLTIIGALMKEQEAPEDGRRDSRRLVRACMPDSLISLWS
jgi:hypothetical protein